MFGSEDEKKGPGYREPLHLDFPLENGYQAFVSLDHFILGQHLLDYGTPVSIPPEGPYGTRLNSALAERGESHHPQVALGIRGYGIMHMSNQSARDQSMLRDTMVEGLPESPFLDFIDGDGERNNDWLV